MTRIISGKWKSRMLRVPQGVTRPTTSRVREAIFSTVLHEIGSFDGIQVLDLYAGSGALGIESISRGAHNAVFVDNDRNAVSMIKSNLGGLGHAQTEVIRNNVAAYLGQPSEHGTFDVVFIDPPYSVVDAVIEDHLELLAHDHWLNPDALVVIERDTQSVIEWPSGFQGFEPRSYGDTAVWYGRYVGSSEGDVSNEGLD